MRLRTRWNKLVFINGICWGIGIGVGMMALHRFLGVIAVLVLLVMGIWSTGQMEREMKK